MSRLCRDGVVHKVRLTLGERPIEIAQAFAAGVFETDRNITAIIRKIASCDKADTLRCRVAFIADARLRAHGDAFIVVLEHEVDDARNRICAVDGRRPACEYFDTVEQFDRDGIGVGL